MTNYKERLDEILDKVFMAGLGIAAAEDIAPEDHDVAILNTQKHYVSEAKQAITILIKELVAEARIDEIKKYCTPSIYQAARQLNLETPKTWEVAHELGLTPMMADGRIKELKAQQEEV